MTAPRLLVPLLSLTSALAGCDASEPAPDASAPVAPAANPDREILDTRLAFDVAARTGTATITFGPSDRPGATLEVGDLQLGATSVETKVGALAPRPTIDLAVPASADPITVDVAWTYDLHPGFEGAYAGTAGGAAFGYSFVWPYFCGNLFPCHSAPADGTTMSLALTGVPADALAVYPTTIAAEAPGYQIAWAYGAYTKLPLGTTTAGTAVAVWYRPGELAKAQAGTAQLVAAFDWLERTIGPYRFGPEVGSVSVPWGNGAFGGMEHHPFWHVGNVSLDDVDTNVHEAAHGWFGDGIRIACWEDFVLSEGTVTYLSGRALDVVAPAVGAQVWASNAAQLAQLPGTAPVWPRTCGAIDIIADGLYTNAPYIRGAFFYRAVALKVGAAQLDQALAAFYAAHAGKAARMTDMLATIRDVTGYDPTACAESWLAGPTRPAAETACP